MVALGTTNITGAACGPDGEDIPVPMGRNEKSGSGCPGVLGRNAMKA